MSYVAYGISHNGKINAAIYNVRCTIATQSGRSAVWLARHVRDVEVLGSNPSAPTIFFSIE